MPRNNKTVYSIPAGEPFLENLVSGLKKLPPEECQSALILLPTRRACSALRDAFFWHHDDGATLLPAIRQLSVIDEDELIVSADADLAQAVMDLPPAISPMHRRLLLTELILARREPDVSHTQAFLLAGDLGHLMDQVLIEDCDFKNLATLVDKELAIHWQKIVTFLSILTQTWPAVLAEQGLIETVERRKRLMDLQIQYWQKNPPRHRVIAAGSTGSHPSTADLLQTIAAMPKGAVILPGLDGHLDEPGWQVLEPTHPQYRLKKLLEKLHVERGDIMPWGCSSQTVPARAQFLSEVMRPAEHSDDWSRLKQSFAQSVPWRGMQSIVAEHEQDEALIAAMMMRETLEHPTHTAALVTPDRSLANRVATLLRRWNVVVDDSAGTPLSQTSLASYMALLLRLPLPDLKPSDVMAFLKHPLTSLGLGREPCLRLARELEAIFFRKQICGRGLATWITLLAPHHPCSGLLTILRDGCSHLIDAHASKPIADWLDAHVALAHALAKRSLWQSGEGEALSEYVDTLRANGVGHVCRFEDYAGIFIQGLRQETLRLRYGQHPRLHILGLIEARMLSFDRVILGGLNEGTWPQTLPQDPWMAPFMRVSFGLPHPEQHIGQTAHDFVQLAAQKNVCLLRCERKDGAPTHPSRWVLRLQAILKMLGHEDALKPTQSWVQWAKTMDAVETVSPCVPPAVSVPVSSMPARISATDIELWIRDPYAFYAKHVLGFRALNELDAQLNAMDRGNIFHAALDALAKTYPERWPPEARQTLITLLAQGFEQHGVGEDERHMMLPRLAGLAEEVWNFEQQRRACVTAFYSEIRGEMPLEFGGYRPVIHAKADRVDMLHDGTVHITDYKTGQTPTETQVQSALKPQLLVEAMIAEKCGFKNVGATKTSLVSYVQITEGEKLLHAKRPITLADDVLETVHHQGLVDFIAAFLKQGALFHSAPRPGLLEPSTDYARLARVAEWSKGEIAQEDAG